MLLKLEPICSRLLRDMCEDVREAAHKYLVLLRVKSKKHAQMTIIEILDLVEMLHTKAQECEQLLSRMQLLQEEKDAYRGLESTELAKREISYIMGEGFQFYLLEIAHLIKTMTTYKWQTLNQ